MQEPELGHVQLNERVLVPKHWKMTAIELAFELLEELKLELELLPDCGPQQHRLLLMNQYFYVAIRHVVSLAPLLGE